MGRVIRYVTAHCWLKFLSVAARMVVGVAKVWYELVAPAPQGHVSFQPRRSFRDPFPPPGGHSVAPASVPGHDSASKRYQESLHLLMLFKGLPLLLLCACASTAPLPTADQPEFAQIAEPYAQQLQAVGITRMISPGIFCAEWPLVTSLGLRRWPSPMRSSCKQWASPA